MVIGTEFEKLNGKFTGRLISANCYGSEKTERIKSWARSFNINIDVKEAWSDHISDFEMISLAKKRCWIGDESLRQKVFSKDPDAFFFER